MRKLAQTVGWPLFALAAAFALWITFVASPELVTSISVPVQYEHLPTGLEIASALPERVHLEIRGPLAGIRRVDPSSAAVVVNLGAVHQPGERTLTLGWQNVDLPPGVRVIRATPRSFGSRSSAISRHRFRSVSAWRSLRPRAIALPPSTSVRVC